MSSSITGVYGIIESVMDAIRQQAKQELKIAEHRYSEITTEIKKNEDEHKKSEQERITKEKNQQAVETAARNKAEGDILSKKSKEDQNRQEIAALLDLAHEKIQQIDETRPERMSLIETVECMEKSIKLFGVTNQTLQQVRILVNSTIPQTINKIMQQKEQQRLEDISHDQLRVNIPVEDHSIGFVSLATPYVEKKQKESNWDIFIERIRLIALQQKRYGECQAEKMLLETEHLPVSKRNGFIVRHNDEVMKWEADAQALSSTITAAQKASEKLYHDYCILYAACDSSIRGKRCDDSVSLGVLQQEYDRLMSHYIAYKKHLYIERVFREVFEKHGFQYEGMEYSKKGQATFNITADNSSSVRFVQSNSGAFEMRFIGKTSSSVISTDDKRRTMEKAHHFCGILPEILEEIREQGIEFTEEVRVEPSEESIEFDVGSCENAFSEQEQRLLEMK